MSIGQSWPDAGSSETFGRYEPLFRIASGGMAEVYAARMLGEGGFEKIVALKRMLPTLAEDEKFVAMFLDEGRLAANISSPHVVQTLDLGRADDDSLYLVMELVIGVSLSALQRRLAGARQLCPVPVAAEILAQAATGLDDAHEARTPYGEPLGIVHRDVTPQNVLVDVNGRVRITDFGVARAMQRMTQTQSGEVKGKLSYFSPEQARGAPLDRRSDVFALGVVGWELFAMQRLFAGENPAETISNVLERPIPRLDAVRKDIPAPLADAIARALDRDPERRTPSAAQLAREVRAAIACAAGSDVGAFVRAHGGDTLTKISDGIRAQQRQSGTPSSGSYDVPRSGSARLRRNTGSGARALAGGGAAVSSDEAPTTLTPSHVLRVRNGVAVEEAAALPGAPTASSTGGLPAVAAEPPSKLPWLVAGTAILALLAAVVVLGTMLYERPDAALPAAAVPVVRVPPAPASAAPAPSAASAPLEPVLAPSAASAPLEPVPAPSAASAPLEPVVAAGPGAPAVEPPSPAAEASTGGARRRPVPRGAAETSAPPAGAAVPAAPAREPAAPAAGSPSSSGRVLRDLSDFEAELGN